MASSLPSSAAPETPMRSRLRSIVGGSTGNMVEWFDWYVYSAFTLYFAPHFFPSGDRTAQLLSAAAVFAVGFVMRPIGAWIMGIYADRHGRKAGLTLSVTLMCAGSLIIACTPGFATIGVAAPALLVIARLMQGLSVGGEYGASATYLSEMAGRARRGFYSSFQYVTLISGQLLAIAVLLVLQAVMDASALEEWGWRIPFVIGALLAVVVFRLRRGLAETDSFQERQGRRRAALRLLDAGAPPPARNRAGDAAHRGGHARLLRLFDLHAEVPGQHQRLHQAGGEPDQRRHAVRLHVSAAAGRRAVRPDRAQAADDRVRGGRRALHLSDLHRAGADARHADRRVAGDGGRW